MLTPGLGGGAHGRAALRIVKGMIGWMVTNANDIPGLDPARPLLPQLDLLTPDQIREAARSLDPLAGAGR